MHIENQTFAFVSFQKEATSALAHGGAVLDLSGFRSASELESVGMDRLKSALQALGLKCGGTLQERATRLFATKNKRPDQIDSSLFAKTGKKSADKYVESFRPVLSCFSILRLRNKITVCNCSVIYNDREVIHCAVLF